MQWIFWLFAVLLSAAAAFWVYRADKRRAVPYPWITSLLRGLVVFFTLLLVLVPTIVITKNVVEKPIVLLLQDDSRSVANALGADSTIYRKNAEALTQKLSEQYKVVTWRFGNTVETDSLFQYRQNATDISAAMARAQEYFGMQNLGAVVLASDGRFNQGMNPLYQQLSLHSPVYSVAIGDSARQQDLRISRIYANKVVAINSTFEIRADIVAELCKGYNNSVTIKEGDNSLASAPVAINTDKYDRAVSFTIKAGKAGLHHYVISVPEANGERNITNNRKDVFVEITEEKKNILIASAAPHPDVNAIKDALRGLESYKVTIVTGDNFPASLAAYDVIILHGLPSLRNNIAAQVAAAKKPVWLIVAGSSNAAALKTMTSLVHMDISTVQGTDMLGVYNTSFNAFTLPQQVQSVTDKMPPITIYGDGEQTTPGANPLFNQRSGEPLWILQQSSPPAAVLLGEGIWRWRLHEYKNFNDHAVIDECIRQTVTFLAANSSERPFSIVLPKYVWSDQEAISLNAYLRNANNEQVSTPDVELAITDSAGRKQNFSFERSGNAYALNIGIWAGGTYTYSAKTTFNDKTYTANGSFVVESMPVELMESGADYPLLYGVATKYNGGLVPAANIASLYDSITHNDRVKPLIQTNSESVPLVDRKWYFFIILALAVAEWLLRKYWLAQ